MTLTPRGNLVAFLEKVIPSGEAGDRIKTAILRLADEQADEKAAAMVEQYARGPLRTGPRGPGRRAAS